MAMELAAQAIEGVSHAEGIDLDVVIAAVTRRVRDLRSERMSEGSDPEGPSTSHVRH